MSVHKEHDFLAKIIIIGDSGVGKTNLLTKYCNGVFQDSYVATIGVDFKLKTVEIDNCKVKLQIWDTAGQERFRNITQTYFKGAAGIILTYAINSKQSFRNINTWIKQVQSNTTEAVCKMLVGTKSDLFQEREVDADDAKKLAKDHNMMFLQVSAKNGENIEETFISLTKEIKNNRAGGVYEEESLNLRGSFENRKKCSC